MRLKRKDFLSIAELDKSEIELALKSAESFKEVSTREIKKVPTLRGKTIINLFYESSTRTRTSFEIAAKRMSADAINISVASSSTNKGETLSDTARNLEAMSPDCIVVRHGSSGAPAMLANYLTCSVINAGDGAHEHPSQALLDMLTIKEKFGTLEGIRLLIVGDIAHSRVARSNIIGFKKLGADVLVCGPPTMIPPGIEDLGCTVVNHIEEGLGLADAIMMLRIQTERQNHTLFPSLREYAKLYGLDKKKLERAKDSVVILHPGPINRGVEISPEVADGPWSLILEQVKNGVAVRMALFYLLLGGPSVDAS
ncbi:MAG: aspartate carbamoyltransferase catalytic subunit [Deltaproteobacteria bacterium]|nr:aspartate carbamoyltransferase catalytic subunit [Deltaproteobacteria bacterium]